VAEVSAITNAALASAAAIGNQPKGSVTADITTSYTGGSYVDGKYAGATARDNRAGQSTIGNLVADSLVASLGSADRGGADLIVIAGPTQHRGRILRPPGAHRDAAVAQGADNGFGVFAAVINDQQADGDVVRVLHALLPNLRI